MYVFINVAVLVLGIGLCWLSGTLLYDGVSVKMKRSQWYRVTCVIGYFIVSALGIFLLYQTLTGLLGNTHHMQFISGTAAMITWWFCALFTYATNKKAEK